MAAAAVIKRHATYKQATAAGRWQIEPVKPAMHMQPAAFSHLLDSMMPAQTAIHGSLGSHCNLLVTTWLCLLCVRGYKLWRCPRKTSDTVSKISVHYCQSLTL